jgi:ATP-binding cassette, subfamily B, bacterial
MNSTKEYLSSIWFVLGYYIRFVPKLTGVMSFLYMVNGVLPYLNAFLLGRLVNSVISASETQSYTTIWPTLVLYGFFSALPTIIGNFQKYVNRRMMLPLSTEVDLEILRHRERIDIATYEDPKFQDLIQRTMRNGLSPIYQIGSSQFDSIRALTSFLVGTILSIHFSLWVYVIVIVTAIPVFITDVKYAGHAWSIWAKDSPALRRLANLRWHIMSKGLLIETKLFQVRNKIFSWIRDIYTNFNQQQLKLETSKVWHTTFADLFAFVGLVVALFLVVKSVVTGGSSIGSLVYMMGTLSSVRGSIANLLEIISGQFENHLIVQDMKKLLTTPQMIEESQNPEMLSLTKAPEIVFENVSFHYANSDKSVLKNVNFTWHPGEKIGLVGNNGAGKTTLVKLLCRVYDPTEGRILINGIDLKEVSIKEWWSYLGMMFQDYSTYDFLVKEAIAIGRPDVKLDMSKVKSVAQMSQAESFIEEWENKYDHQIGVEFSGVEPSKGQKQKLSIAKVLYREPFVMVLDEPTASVDAESEARIFESLESLSDDLTAILISHDFSTISECDRIFVLENGELIENGTHKELMGLKGKYAELYNLQAERFKK